MTSSSPNASEQFGLIDWSREKSQWIPWDDGHTPECVKEQPAETGLRIYPDWFHNDELKFVETVQNAGPQALADRIYNFTVNQVKGPTRTWGTYVLLKDAKQHAVQSIWTQNDDCTAPPSLLGLDQLAQQAAAVFLQSCVNATKPKRLDDFLVRIGQAHGIAVWALAANVGSSVPYHIDYAEWIRYKHGVTVLPVLAGTWQCTRDEANIRGGELWVHTRGLDHYRDHGYKGVLRPVNEDDPDWVKVPYQFNQMIVQSGHLPHLSTTVSAMTDHWTRVIVGFNVFLNDIGPAVQDAPEHSDSFRTKVQAMRLCQQRKECISNMNPVMKRLLVMAKRKKVKQDYVDATTRLDETVRRYLLGNLNQPNQLSDVLSHVQRLKSDERWPCNDDDIMSHLLRRSKEGAWLLEDGTIKILSDDFFRKIVDLRVSAPEL